jgi:hypothetical protein
MGVIWRIFRLMVYKHGHRKYFALSIFFMIISIDPVFSQCPGFSSKNTNISVEPDQGNFSIKLNSDINLNTLRVMLYNYDAPGYYYDSWNRERVNDVSGLRVMVNPENISVRGLPAGDFSIIIEKEGCKKQVIGLGYSGFPNSAIKIE